MSEENTESTDAMTAEEANRNRLLILEDRRKYELAKARTIAQAYNYDALIAECDLAIADINRREAGVEYPVSEPKSAPEMKVVSDAEGK